MYLALLKLFSLFLEAVDWIRLHALRYFDNPVFQGGSGNTGERAGKLPLSDWRYPITVVFALFEAIVLIVWRLFKGLFFFNIHSLFEFFLSAVKIVIVLSVLSVVGLYGYLSAPVNPDVLLHYKSLYQKNTATALLGQKGRIIGAISNPLTPANIEAPGSLYVEMVPPVYWDMLDFDTQRQLNFDYEKTRLVDVIFWRHKHFKGISLAALFNTINPFSTSSQKSLTTQLAININGGEKAVSDRCWPVFEKLCKTLMSVRFAKHTFPYLAENKGAEFKRWVAIHGGLQGFDNDISGLRATAEVVFNKKPEQLNNAEQALMAVAQLNHQPLLDSRDLGELKNKAITLGRELYTLNQPALANNIEQGLLDLNLNKINRSRTVDVSSTEQSNLSLRSVSTLGNFTDLIKTRLSKEYQVVGDQRIISDAQITLPVNKNNQFKQRLLSRLEGFQRQCPDCGLNYQLGAELADAGANIEIMVADQEGQIVRYFKRGNTDERAVGALSSIPAAVLLTTLGNTPSTRFCNQTYRNLPSAVAEFPRGIVNCQTIEQPGHSLTFQESIQVRASLPLFYALRKQSSAQQLQDLYRNFGFTDLRTKAGNDSHGEQLAYEMSYGVLQSSPLQQLDVIHQLGDVLYGRSQSKAIIGISQFLVSDLETKKRYLEFNKSISEIAIKENYVKSQNAKAGLRQLLSFDLNSQNAALKSLRDIKNTKFLLTKTGQSYTKVQTLRDHWLVASVLVRGRRYSVSAFVGSPTGQVGLAKKLTAEQVFRPIMVEIMDSLD